MSVVIHNGFILLVRKYDFFYLRVSRVSACIFFCGSQRVLREKQLVDDHASVIIQLDCQSVISPFPANLVILLRFRAGELGENVGNLLVFTLDLLIPILFVPSVRSIIGTSPFYEDRFYYRILFVYAICPSAY